MAAVAFSAIAGLEPPLRNLIKFARAGASFSAKQLCSSVLMAGMDPDQVLKEDLAAGEGMIHTPAGSKTKVLRYRGVAYEPNDPQQHPSGGRELRYRGVSYDVY